MLDSTGHYMSPWQYGRKIGFTVGGVGVAGGRRKGNALKLSFGFCDLLKVLYQFPRHLLSIPPYANIMREKKGRMILLKCMVM